MFHCCLILVMMRIKTRLERYRKSIHSFNSASEISIKEGHYNIKNPLKLRRITSGMTLVVTVSYGEYNFKADNFTLKELLLPSI